MPSFLDVFFYLVQFKFLIQSSILPSAPTSAIDVYSTTSILASIFARRVATPVDRYLQRRIRLVPLMLRRCRNVYVEHRTLCCFRRIFIPGVSLAQTSHLPLERMFCILRSVRCRHGRSKQSKCAATATNNSTAGMFEQGLRYFLSLFG